MLIIEVSDGSLLADSFDTSGAEVDNRMNIDEISLGNKDMNCSSEDALPDSFNFIRTYIYISIHEPKIG